MKKLLLIIWLSFHTTFYAIKFTSIFASSSFIAISGMIANKHYHNEQILKKYMYKEKYQNCNNIFFNILELTGGGHVIIRKKRILPHPMLDNNSKYQIKRLDELNSSELKEFYALNELLTNLNGITIGYPHLEKTKKHTLIAQLPDGTICGGVCYSPKEFDIYIDNIAVHPNHRRQGIAKQLIQEIERKNPDKQMLELYVNLYNSAAMITYDKIGFK